MDTRTHVALLALSLVGTIEATGCSPTRFVPTETRGFFARDTAGHKHEIYLPDGWSADKKWPVILFLHGGGERGSDGIRPTQEGLGPVVWQSDRKFPFIVVFPQDAKGQFWAYRAMEQRAMAALDDVIANYGGDPTRVYLTGNSMGGYGTWITAARNPGRFAALAPICGGVKVPFGVPIPKDARDDIVRAKDPYTVVANKIGPVPVWAFHGARDPLVPVSESLKLTEAMKRIGAEVKLTVYPGVGHRSWDRAYAEPGLFEWLLAHHL